MEVNSGQSTAAAVPPAFRPSNTKRRLTPDHDDDRMATEWLTPSMAAQRIGVNKQMIYDACAAGGLKHIRLAGRRIIRIRTSDLEAWMTEHEVVNQ